MQQLGDAPIDRSGRLCKLIASEGYLEEPALAGARGRGNALEGGVRGKLGQSLEELLLGMRAVERIESSALDHRIADEIEPGLQQLEITATCSNQGAAPASDSAGYLNRGGGGMVQTHFQRDRGSL